STLTTTPKQPRPTAINTTSLTHQLAVLSEPEQHHHLLTLVRTHAAAVLGHPTADTIHPNNPFKDHRFHSLPPLELRHPLHPPPPPPTRTATPRHPPLRPPPPPTPRPTPPPPTHRRTHPTPPPHPHAHHHQRTNRDRGHGLPLPRRSALAGRAMATSHQRRGR